MSSSETRPIATPSDNKEQLRTALQAALDLERTHDETERSWRLRIVSAAISTLSSERDIFREQAEKNGRACAEKDEQIAGLSSENAVLREALTNIASTDRAFVEAQGGDDAAICAIIEHARAALSQDGGRDG